MKELRFVFPVTIANLRRVLFGVGFHDVKPGGMGEDGHGFV